MKLENKEPAVMHSFGETARLMGVSKTVVYDLVRAGRLRAVSIGTRGRRIPRSEIDRFVAEALGR